MQTDWRVDVVPFSRDFGLFGQQREQTVDRLNIGPRPLLPPGFNAKAVDAVKISDSEALDDNLPRHCPLRSARKASRSQGTDGPDASPSSTSACISAIARARS